MPRTIPPPTGRGGRVEFRDSPTRLQRLEIQFEEALAAFDDQVQFVQSLAASDPQLVLVFEAVDENIDLGSRARTLGFDVLRESEDAVAANDEFQIKSKSPKDDSVGVCLHAVCTDQKSFDRILKLWRAWRAGEQLPHGNAPLRELFSHLKDVRAWGPQDRVRVATNWDDYFAGLLEDRLHPVELELWYRSNQNARAAAEREIAELSAEAGGRVVATRIVHEVGYHGMKCELPTDVLRRVAAGEYGQVRLARSTSVMYFRVGGQSLATSAGDESSDVSFPDVAPSGSPKLCLLDGVPAANHPRLSGRVIVYDPDDLQSRAVVSDLKHGTWMASAAVWGDLDVGEPPATRPVLVRPVLTPAVDTKDRLEEVPEGELVPDLMLRVFRELFEGTSDTAPIAPSVRVVSISIGDPAAPFDSVISSWARVLDWASYKYGVLVIVSAGNHLRLPLGEQTVGELSGLEGADRMRAVLSAMRRHQFDRRLLAPAEAINAVTVGAVHRDGSKATASGYTADPAPGLVCVSPVSAVGAGYRRSIKPDIAANGGRVLYRTGGDSSNVLEFSSATGLGVGIGVVSPLAGRRANIAGTSVAAALVARHAERLSGVVEQLAEGDPGLSRRHVASGIKALLIHGASQPVDVMHEPLEPQQALGNGVLTRDLTDGCDSNEAVLLYFGTIGAREQVDLTFPLPDGLGVRDTKRVDATLAWLSPVNWRHRQYRRANLAFSAPSGAIPDLGPRAGLPAMIAKRGATTVVCGSWETERAFGSGTGSNMTLRVSCQEQGGGLAGERVDFAVAVSLWVAPRLNVDVYSQVRDQVASRVSIQQT